jgi:hypothetical protein
MDEAAQIPILASTSASERGGVAGKQGTSTAGVGPQAEDYRGTVAEAHF